MLVHPLEHYFLETIASANFAATILDFTGHESFDFKSGRRAGDSDLIIYDREIVRDGDIQLSDKPGLGLEVNRDVAMKHLLARRRSNIQRAQGKNGRWTLVIDQLIDNLDSFEETRLPSEKKLSNGLNWYCLSIPASPFSTEGLSSGVESSIMFIGMWGGVRAALIIGAVGSAVAVERPPIVGIANFVVKTDDLGEVRKFYTGVLGYDEVFKHRRPDVAGEIAVFKVNDRQYIEVSQTLANQADDKLIQIGFETKDARQLRDYLAEKNWTVPAKAGKDGDGNYSFAVNDPEGHKIEFVEYVKGSLHSRNFGRAISPNRISDHMLHVGVHVKNAEVQDKFYKDLLGFRLQWKGGPLDDRVDWISLLTPDGDNWIEYMMSRDTPNPEQLGVWHHVAVGTLDIQGLYKTVVSRGYTPRREPNIARDGRWLLQLYDKHNTRTEVMVRKPVQKPCCSENVDPYVK